MTSISVGALIGGLFFRAFAGGGLLGSILVWVPPVSWLRFNQM